ncbi:MAG: carboxypeptidase-like regulatory domain-containing protein [Gemmatirosa sp.]
MPVRPLAALLALLLLVPAAAAQRPRPAPRAPAQPWWADSTRWPPGTFRRTTTTRPARVVAVGDTLRFDGPALPVGLPDSIARDVRWGAEDPRVVAFARPAVAVARTAGSTVVTAWTRVGPTLTPVRVVAALRGRLHTADGAPPPGARVVVRRASGRADTLRTDAAGRFALPLTGARSAESDAPRALRVVPEAEPGGAPWFGAETLLPAPFDGRAADVVLVPRRWTVAAGTYAGRTIEVDLDAARASAADGSRFWRAARLRPDTTAGESAGTPVGWPDARRPIPLAVWGARGAAASRFDSAAFWSVARGLERDWGGPLFRPVPAAAPRDSEWWGITAQVTPGLNSAGFATVSWNGEGEIGDALVEVRSHALLGDRHVVGHELLHALGFGHVSRWRSVLGGEAHAPHEGPTALSLEDVAYGRLLDAARRVARRTGAPFGLAEAVP